MEKTRKKEKVKATKIQARAIEIIANGEKSISKAMREAGYSAASAKNPKVLTDSRLWADLMQDFFPDVSLATIHKALLNSHRLDHMIFPLGPEDDEKANPDKEDQSMGEMAERTTLTDIEIKDMLADLGCTVRRVVHGQTARHVYFWSPDNKSRMDALDLAYKLKGKYAAVKVDYGLKDNLTAEQKAKLDHLVNMPAPKITEASFSTGKKIEKIKSSVKRTLSVGRMRPALDKLLTG